MSVRQRVFRQLNTHEVTPQDSLQAVVGIGPYLLRRFQYTMNVAGDITVQEFWNFFRNLRTAMTLRLVRRALQNERANQCVRANTTQAQPTYHTGDINVMGYESVVSVLEYARLHVHPTAYGVFPRRLTSRPQSSKTCACKLVCDGPCRLTQNGLCVPRAHNARGFEGVQPQDGQRVIGRTPRRYLALSAALQGDPDSVQDLVRGHARNLGYSSVGSRRKTHWRRPSRKVRVARR